MTTPGHTGEHLSFELLDGSSPVGIFTGGSLIVGGAARTDLAGADRTEELTRLQYRSLQRLALLPDATKEWPTHGAGSFCSAPRGGERTSTIRQGKNSNPLLSPRRTRTPSSNACCLGWAAFLPTSSTWPRSTAVAPPWFRIRLSQHWMPRKVSALMDSGAVLIDVRPVRDFAAGHIPGALSIPLRPQFVSWLGWLLEPGTPLVVVRNADQDLAEVTWQALKIGFGQPSGELAGGMPAWDGPATATP